MDTTLENVEKEAFSLTAADRARLAMDLIKSLDNQDDTDAEDLWLQETERRYQEYREGSLTARPAEDVFRDAFAKLR
jgi:putative addiction module component (TIGR02574 family)